MLPRRTSVIGDFFAVVLFGFTALFIFLKFYYAFPHSMEHRISRFATSYSVDYAPPANVLKVVFKRTDLFCAAYLAFFILQ